MICNLCPRRCGALRTETEGRGVCRMPEAPGGWPVRPSTSGRSRPSRARGAPAPCFSRLLPGVCLLPERRHQPPGLWTAHLPGAAACHLLRAHRPGGPQHQPGQSHPLCPRGGPAAGPAAAGAGGVELRRLRPGGHPAGPGGENPDLPARFEVCHAGVRGAVFRRRRTTRRRPRRPSWRCSARPAPVCTRTGC